MNKKIFENHLFLLALIINSFVLYVFINFSPVSFHVNDNMDYIKEYNSIAINIVNGEKYNHVEPDICLDACEDVALAQFRRPPVFPILIALSYKLESVTKINQYDLLIFLQYSLHLISSLIILLIYLKWTGVKIIALFASIIYASYPLGLYLLKQPNSEVIFNFVLCIFLLIFSSIIRDKKFVEGYSLIGAGSLLGILILTRSLSIAFPILIAIYVFLFYKTQVIKIFTKLILGILLVLIPWQIYVGSLSSNEIHVTDSEIVESRKFSTTVLVYGLFWEQMPGRDQSKSAEFMSEDLMQFMKKTHTKSVQGLLNSKYEVFTYMGNEALKSPLVMLELGLWKMLRAFFGTDSKRYEFEVLLINFFYLSFLALFFIRRKKYLLSEEDKKHVFLFSIICLYFILISALFIPLVRYSLSGFLIFVPLISLLMKKPEN